MLFVVRVGLLDVDVNDIHTDFIEATQVPSLFLITKSKPMGKPGKPARTFYVFFPPLFLSFFLSFDVLLASRV